MNTVKLSMTEARSTEGVLCWQSDRSGWVQSKACSLLLAHRGGHRFDMDIQPDPMPLRRFLVVAAPGFSLGLVASVIFLLWLR